MNGVKKRHSMRPRKLSFDKIVSPDKIPLSWVLCGYFFLIYFSFFGYSSEWVAVLPDLDISARCSSRVRCLSLLFRRISCAPGRDSLTRLRERRLARPPQLHPVI